MDQTSEELRCIEVRPSALTKTLATCIVGFVLAHLLVLFLLHGLGYNYAKGFVPAFHLGGELNVPSLFSAGLLAAGALGFYLLYRFDETIRLRSQPWRVLSVLFVFLSADEWFSLHERWVDPVRELFNTSGIFYYAWVIPYGVLVILIGVYVLPHLMRLPPKIRSMLLAAAGVYLFGAMGMEFVEGWFAGTRSWVVALAVMVEESCEMIGLTTLLYAQTRLLSDQEVGLRIQFSPR